MSGQSRPTLLSSCARAASAAEARYRIPYPNSQGRSSRIFALDAAAEEAMQSLEAGEWAGARFLTVVATGSGDSNVVPVSGFDLRLPDGASVPLAEALDGADLVVLLSAGGDNADAARAIAREASNRRIMTAGLALAEGLSSPQANRVVNGLRPFTSVLVVASDNDFIPAMLTALRA